MTRACLSLSFFLAIAACAVGPDYKRPETPAADAAFKETPQAWKEAHPSDAIARGKWWEMFGDPELSALVEKIEAGNFSLAASEAQYRQAQAALGVARSGLLPSVDANASVTRSRSPTGVIGGTTAGRTVTTRSASLSTNWEIDLWGHVRRQVEAANASLEASAGDLAAAKLSLEAQLMTAYFQLRSLDAQKKLFEDTVAALRTSLELTNNRYKVGVAARADVVAADAQLKSALSQSVDLDVQRAQLEHAIAILTGVPPSRLSIERKENYQATVPVIPPGLPSALLERRPDVAAAERRVAAANAQIGVAKSAFFPTLTLSGQYGYRSGDPAVNLFELPNRFWSIGPALAMSLFDAGLRRAQTDQAIAAYDATVANYRQTTLTAIGEVEDNLAALRVLDEEARLQADSVAAARQTLDLTLNQYKAGVVSYLNVVTATANYLAEQRSAANVMQRRLTAAVALVRAIGGGWDASQLTPRQP